MQSAMAGGAAGGAAAASWRWIIGPAAGAAVLGGYLWFADPFSSESAQDVLTESPEKSGSERDAVSSNGGQSEHAVMGGENGEQASPEGPTSGETLVGMDANESDEAMATVVDRRNSSDQQRTAHGRAKTKAEVVAPVDVPEDWAELPAEKAAAFGVDIEAACVGTEIGFRMANPMNDVRVLWNFGDGQFSSMEAPQHVFDAPGTYDITLSVTRISDGLIRTRTIENLVTIHPNPLAEFTWEVPGVSERNPTVRMRNRSRDASSATWVVDGESSQAGESADFVLDRVGEHVVQLVASSPHGCQSVASHSIEIGNRFGIGGSGRFSPDGDGHYDRFMPRGLAQLEWPFVFRVEDESGHIVFETTEPKPWDGTLPTGQNASEGETYGWTVVVQGKAGPAYFSDVVLVE